MNIYLVALLKVQVNVNCDYIIVNETGLVRIGNVTSLCVEGFVMLN